MTSTKMILRALSVLVLSTCLVACGEKADAQADAHADA